MSRTSSLSTTEFLSQTRSLFSTKTIELIASSTETFSQTPLLVIPYLTICQELLLFTGSENITYYECLDSNRKDLATADMVCNDTQLAYMLANSSSFCGQQKTDESYPYICYNSSNLCRDPQLFPTRTCPYNITMNTLCDHPISITLTNSSNHTMNVFALNISANQLFSSYNALCVPNGSSRNYYYCVSIRGILRSEVANQIGKLGWPQNPESFLFTYLQYKTYSSYFLAQYAKLIFYYHSCSSSCYSPISLFQISKIDTTLRCIDSSIYSSNQYNYTYCPYVNTSKFLFGKELLLISYNPPANITPSL